MSTATSPTAVQEDSQTQSGERRRSPRQPYVAVAWVSPETGVRAPDSEVVVGDLSLHGVGFTCNADFRTDATHWIVIGTGGLRASGRIRIVSSRKRPNGGYDVGAEFF